MSDCSWPGRQQSPACGQLNAFSNHVSPQSGNQLSVTQADQALADVARIEAVIRC